MLRSGGIWFFAVPMRPSFSLAVIVMPSDALAAFPFIPTHVRP